VINGLLKMAMGSHHVGSTKGGKDFAAYLGQDVSEESLSNEYDDFLHEVFSTYACDDMPVTKDLLDFPAAEDRAERALEEGRGSSNDEHVIEADNERPVNQGTFNQEPPKPRKNSEYELTRQKNIAENKAKLNQIRADIGLDVEKWNRGPKGSAHKKKGKGNAKDVTVLMEKRGSPRFADAAKRSSDVVDNKSQEFFAGLRRLFGCAETP